MNNTIANKKENEGKLKKNNIILQFEHSFFEPRPEQTFRSIITDRWSYSYFLEEGPTQLYNLQEDPY